jgi:hypothetical protein
MSAPERRRARCVAQCHIHPARPAVEQLGHRPRAVALITKRSEGFDCEKAPKTKLTDARTAPTPHLDRRSAPHDIVKVDAQHSDSRDLGVSPE